MKLVSLGWTAQNELVAKLAHFRPLAPELYAGQNEGTARQIADLCAALNHPETDTAVVIVGPRAEVFAAVDPLAGKSEGNLQNVERSATP